MSSSMLRWLAKRAALVGLATSVSCIALGVIAASPGSDLGDLRSVLGELRMGGLVIYFRHGATDRTGTGDEAADLAMCETQRNLSAEGRVQAVRIGKSFKALRIPVGTITTSPFCRTKDTAKLAFGRLTVSNDLYFAIGTSALDTKRFAESLRAMLSTLPASATNSVIVSHSANLREATGFWPKREGMAYVFRPLPGGRFEAIAMIPPEEWSEVAGLETTKAR